ncbi:MAG: hypothetical protein KC912_09955 [Proteobacteria bacterium]|nr:hypothetical protein [Pseudomonadota bacterium]
MGIDDPFAPPKAPTGEVIKEHRAPAAAGRFKQIDKYAEKKKKKQNAHHHGLPKKPKVSDARRKQLAEAEELARREIQRKRLTAQFGEEAAQRMLTKSATENAPTPQVPKKRRRPTVSAAPPPVANPTEEGAPLDRRPPRIIPTAQSDERRSIRVTSARDEDGVDRRPPRIAGPSKPKSSRPRMSRSRSTAPTPGDDAVDRRPPRVGRAAPEQGPSRRPRVTEAPGDIDRRPPRVGLAARPEPVAEAAEVDRRPPRKPAAPERSLPSSGGGMDDLFGGMQEGRIKRPKKTEDGPRRPVVTAPTEGLDRSPPKPGDAPPVDRTPPRLAHTPPPKRKPFAEADGVAPEAPVDRTPPKPSAAPVDRTPPRKGSSGGLDDLFGGMQQGRIKRPPKADGPRRPVVTAPTEGLDRRPPKPGDAPPVDRTPPRLAHTPAPKRKPFAEADGAVPEAPVDRTPPKPSAAPVDRTPPRKGSSGGLDDLFGGMQQGRIKRPPRADGPRRPVVTAPTEGLDRTPPKPGDTPPVDRTPPRLAHTPAPKRKPFAEADGVVPETPIDRTPPRPSATPVDRTPPRRGSGGSAMDGLFGGTQQGRIKRPKKADGPRRPVVTAPTEGIDRTPPKPGAPAPVDRTPPRLAHTPAPKRKPFAEADAAPVEPAIDRTPPKPSRAPVDRTPPRKSAGGSGMDGLFGGSQQGRIKRPKKSDGPRRPVVTSPSESDPVDRRPPRLPTPKKPKD